jgi:peptide/nickel transport system permease protein
VWGSRLALIIGLLTTLVSVSIGLIYAVVSAYLGGMVDELMQRIQEIVASLPLLPLLIILSYLMKPSIWNLALIMAAFSWVGPVKTVRSMALQFKEEPYVEASRALGASSWRIITKHIIPQILPYTFAMIALAVPGAILTEAGVSFLMGAEGVSEPTWGRILHDAQRASATTNGMWWWVGSPGLLISGVGLSFVFIGTALDKILNPRLRR